jgi:hypothetical protein
MRPSKTAAKAVHYLCYLGKCSLKGRSYLKQGEASIKFL